MATAIAIERTDTAAIGETAGKVWQYLAEFGPVPISTLAAGIDQPRDRVMQAVGWLAREDKVVVERVGRTKKIALC